MKKYKMQTNLSSFSLDTLIKRLEIKKEKYPKIAMRITERLTDEMMEDIYPDSYKVPVRLRENGKIAEGKIRNDKEKWTYHEFGTGIIGSEFPHVDEELQKMGWKYDVNAHGEKGWWYPTTESDPNPYKWTDESGTLRAWTKGLPAERAFYNALKRAEERFIEVAQEELEKEVE